MVNLIVNRIFLLYFGFFALVTSYYLLLALVGLFESRKKLKEHESEDYASFLSSSFTLPVTVMIPCRNEQAWIADSVSAALNLKYPEFELLIVNDGSTDQTFQELDKLLDLKPVNRSYVERFKAGRISGIFASEKYKNVTVISKESGFKKAGALNTGLNFAKYRFVCFVDADTILDPDALMKVMPQIQKDPENVIGLGSYFSLANCLNVKEGKVIAWEFICSPLIAMQNIEYIRSFIGNRAGWSRYNIIPVVAGGFAIWRKDILFKLGGFSSEFTCEDIEFTFRAQDYIAENNKRSLKILSLPYHIGWTEGPSSLKSLIIQRIRWQRVTNETIWYYRHMLFNPRHGTFAFLTLPYFLVYEVLGVFVELSSLALAATGLMVGAVSWQMFAGFLIFLALCQALISLLSLFSFVRNEKIFSTKEISYFVMLIFTEFFWYKWLLMKAKILGAVTFLQGVRAYESYERQARKSLQPIQVQKPH